MYLFKYEKAKEQWAGCAAKLPFTVHQINNLILQDEELMEHLSRIQKNKCILEADIIYLGASIRDKKYERPANPPLCVIGEAMSGMILNADLTDADKDPRETLADHILDFILRRGAPKEIRVANVITEAVLGHICKLAGVKLRRVRRLPALEEFKQGMGYFM